MLVAPILLTASLTGPPVGLDDEATASEYTCLSANKRYKFVMLVPKGVIGLREGLGKRYRASGLYPNNGSKTPIWTINWYAFEVSVANDGHHLVRWGPWPGSGDQGRTLALAFYRDGSKFRSYTTGEIYVDTKELPMTNSHYMWRKSLNLDDAASRVTAVVLTGHDYAKTIRIVFDIRTGNELTRAIPIRI